MRAPIAITSAALLLAITACGDGDANTGTDTEAQEESAPATDTNDTVAEDELEEIEERITETVDREVEGCAEDIANGETTLPCSSTVFPQGAFFLYFEEQEGYPIPDEHKPDNLPAECEQMGREFYEMAEYGTADDEAEIDALMDDLQTECGDMPF